MTSPVLPCILIVITVMALSGMAAMVMDSRRQRHEGKGWPSWMRILK